MKPACRIRRVAVWSATMLLLGAAGTGLSGCAATPSRAALKLEPNVAAQWRQAPGTDAPIDDALLAQWWRGSSDPVLSSLVEQALAQNLDIFGSQAALVRARALRDVAAATRMPQLATAANAGRQRSAGRYANNFGAELDASWEADVFGALAASAAAADAQAESSALSLAATRIGIAGEVALAYFQLQGTRRQAEIARQNLAVQTDSLQTAQWRAGAGLATALDVEQARASVEQVRARLPALETTQAQTLHRLTLLLGQPPGAPLPVLAGALAGPAAVPRLPPLPSLGLPADLLRRRPDLRAAEASARAALATLAQREAERRPRFTISGKLGLQAVTLAALGQPAALVAGLTGSVQWPLADGGAGAAQVTAQQAALDSARFAYQAAVLKAQQDVEDALVALSQGRLQAASLASAAQAAAEALALARLRYQAGQADFTTLLDAQRSALAAEDALASLQTELALHQVRLYKALGGGWSITAVSE